MSELAKNILKQPSFYSEQAASALTAQNNEIVDLKVACEIYKEAVLDRDAEIIDMRHALAAQEAELDTLRKDAERYRWLRIQDDEDFCFAVVKNPHFDIYEANELDAAIDEELTKEATK